MAKTIVPLLVRQAEEHPIRVWVPGCSTGEEAYSLAMLFMEEFAAVKRAPKLQIFASDVSADAVTFGRNGVYPDTIKVDVSAERLQRFFTREDQGYQVSRELRDPIVFTVHDLLADPPFSHLDLISCRNLLIYLQPEEQQKIVSLFHFALNENGYLFLGVSETIGQMTGLFEPISQQLCIFRRIGHDRPRERALSADLSERAPALWPRALGRVDRRPPNIADVAQRCLLDTYAPAAVLVDRNYRALYFAGPTDRYLRVASGEPSQDVLAMLRSGLAPKFRAAVRQASREHAVVNVGGARVKHNGDSVSVASRRSHHSTKARSCCSSPLLMNPTATFPPRPKHRPKPRAVRNSGGSSKTPLENTIRELEESNQELSAINEEALSIWWPMPGPCSPI